MNNPRAFPVSSIDGFTQHGMSLRDWFASHCPQWWMDSAMPSTVGVTRDALIKRGLIPPSRKNCEPAQAYSSDERRLLFVALHWEYADAMLAERAKAVQQ